MGRVLADRMLPERNPKVLAEMVKVFKNANYMKRVRLLVRFFTERGGRGIAWHISPTPIIDIGSREIGALELHDVTPLKSCVRGGRKIIMISEYDLADETVPVFQVWKDNIRRHDLEQYVRQPPELPGENTINFRKSSIIFLTPAQTQLDKLGQGAEIRLTLIRKGDGQNANNSFPFTYEQHAVNGRNWSSPVTCVYCDHQERKFMRYSQNQELGQLKEL